MKKTLIAACAAMAFGAAVAEEPKPPKRIFGETDAQRSQRMAWWTDSRFGMFIHFGRFYEKVKYAQFLHDGSKILIKRPGRRHGQSGELKPVGGLVLPVLKPHVEVPVIEVFL